MTTHRIDDVNRWDYDEFIERLGGVVEHFAPLMAGLWSRRPFDSLGDLHTKLCSLMNDLPFEGEPILQCRSHSKQLLSCFACLTPLLNTSCDIRTSRLGLTCEKLLVSCDTSH